MKKKKIWFVLFCWNMVFTDIQHKRVTGEWMHSVALYRHLAVREVLFLSLHVTTMHSATQETRQHWISRLSCSTSPDVLLLCFILKQTMKKTTKSCLLTMEEGDSVFLRTARNASSLCLLELLSLFYQTKRRIEVKLMLARDLNKGWWDGV